MPAYELFSQTEILGRMAMDRMLAGGWRRLENSPAQEHAAALIEMAKVAGHRFADLVADANPIASACAQAFGRGGFGKGDR